MKFLLDLSFLVLVEIHKTWFLICFYEVLVMLFHFLMVFNKVSTAWTIPDVAGLRIVLIFPGAGAMTPQR